MRKLCAGSDLSMAGVSTEGTRILTQLQRTLRTVRKLVRMKERITAISLWNTQKRLYENTTSSGQGKLMGTRV